MRKLLSTILLAFILLTGCLGEVETFDNQKKIETLGKPYKLEYYKHKEGTGFQWADSTAFVITNSNELKEALVEIRNAKNPEPWKGSGWDKIIIYYKDTILKISTDKKKIGLSASGMFYHLDSDNFISRRLEN